MKTESDWSVLPQDQVFGLSGSGRRELGGSVSTLSARELELLVRMDGVTPLRQVRAAMPSVGDATFAALFKGLWQRGLLREERADAFAAATDSQLRVLAQSLGPEASPQASPVKASLSLGLVWRRSGAIVPGGAPDVVPTAVVVEDDPVLARFIQCFLALEGFQVRLAANRAEVVAGFNAPSAPQVVLLDVTLPDADGFEVLRKVREHPRLRHVPVLMLTSRATREGVLQALADGADGYLTKPFDAEALLRAVRAVTGLPDPAGTAGTAFDPWTNADATATRERHAA
ncbi:response regulator [Ramlibacter sp.]|uniref:response regulator transcription factor n=1 Tax=Ramlibacter sp. TaxID=1917967 RepID=UPI002D79F99C|nr:response regulator [Ramlibacter sp.]